MFKYLLVVIGSLFSLHGNAQKYTTAAGIRLGSELGLTLQQHLFKNMTLEAMVQQGLFNRQTTVTALLEQHHPIFDKATNIYIGAGPHMGFYKLRNTSKTIESTTETSVGATLIAGLEFRVKKLLLSVDYKPSLNLVGGRQFFEGQTGISARYIFIKAKKTKTNSIWPFNKNKQMG